MSKSDSEIDSCAPSTFSDSFDNTILLNNSFVTIRKNCQKFFCLPYKNSLKNNNEIKLNTTPLNVEKTQQNEEQSNFDSINESKSLEPSIKERNSLYDDSKTNNNFDEKKINKNLRTSSRFTLKRRKKKVNFSGLQVFYFNRAQGFDTIPMVGSVSLGMENNHYLLKNFSFYEFYKANRRENSQKCATWRKAVDLKVSQKTTSRVLPKLFEVGQSSSEISISTSMSSSQESFNLKLSEEEQKNQIQLTNDADLTLLPCTSPNSSKNLTITNNTDLNSSSSFSSDEEIGNDFLLMECYLRPIDSKIRKTILRQSGITVDKSVRSEYKEIVSSRLICGCSCVDGKCLPETCDCANHGIMCQVDKPSFPCSCSETDCKNPEGRIEFDPIKVHSHYLQTITRVKGLENCRLSNSPLHIKFADLDE